MKKFNEKWIKIFLIISIVLNVIFLGDGSKKIYERYKHKYRQTHKSKNVQPNSVSYFVGRNEVFTKLPNDSNEIIMLGNSLTQNYEWHEMFKNVNIKNRGINGDITKGILQRLSEVIESKPQKVFIEIGINDLLHGYYVDTIFSNYQRIINTIRLESPNTHIYIQNILPTNWNIYDTDKPVIDSISVLNNKLQSFCRNNKLTYIDMFSKFIIDRGLNSKYDCGDHLHLNGTGYLEWCSLIESYINE